MHALNHLDRDRILRAALRRTLRRTRRNGDDERTELLERALSDEACFSSLAAAAEFEAFPDSGLHEEQAAFGGGAVPFLQWIVGNLPQLMVLIKEIVQLLENEPAEQPNTV